MTAANGQKSSRVFWLTVVTTCAFFLVNTVGFIDTMTGSMLGCGRNWPLCNGSLLPTWDMHALIEFGHRMIVFLASILLVVLSVIAWKRYGSYRRIRVLVLLSLFGVVMQSILGAVAVLFVNPPALLATHMGVALISFCALLNMTVFIRQLEHPEVVPAQQPSKSFARFAWFAIVYAYLAIYFGAYVARSGAGDVFAGFPFPTEPYSIVHSALYIDIAHRSIGLGLLILMVILAVLAKKNRSSRKDLYHASLWAVVLTCLQGLSGWLLIATDLSLASILVHVSIISLLFGLLTVIGVQSLFRFPATSSQEEMNSQVKVLPTA